jgi:mannose-6-phosphate isomerase
LEGVVRPYDWGEAGPGAFLPRWLGADPAAHPRWAELWFGAHPSAPSPLDGAPEKTDLAAWIGRAPEALLGRRTTERFNGRLPFLAKILAVDKPLSIQAHPDKAQAEAGFAAEEAAGVRRDDPRRVFKDDNHKPELLVAMTPFRALKGFRSPADVAARAAVHPELGFLSGGRSLQSLFEAAMGLPPEEADRVLAAVSARIKATGGASPDHPDHWFLRAEEAFCPGARKDPGLFAFFLLDFVTLAPGEALFLGPGELHAYLHGVGAEVMANSDNVLRGGLTPKHVDREGLRRILSFRPSEGSVLRPGPGGAYRTPVPDFAVSLATWAAGERRAAPGREGPSIWLPLDGAAEWRGADGRWPLKPGRALFLPDGAAGELAGVTAGRAVLVGAAG